MAGRREGGRERLRERETERERERERASERARKRGKEVHVDEGRARKREKFIKKIGRKQQRN